MYTVKKEKKLDDYYDEDMLKLILEKCQKYHYLMVRVNYLKGIYFTLRNELDKAQEAYALALTISQKLGIQSGEYYSLIIIDAIAVEIATVYSAGNILRARLS